MIKDGNYYYLDYDAHREKFIDVIVELCGKDKEDIIRQRMDKVVYVPYMKYDNVIDYYSQSMATHADEIYAEFEKISGIKLTDAMKELVFKDGGSRFFLANYEGENLEANEFFLGKEYCDQIREARKAVCEEFGITAENPIPEIQKLCRQVKKALQRVAENHPCQVYKDVEKFIANKNSLLQKYLTHVSKHFLDMTQRDIDIVNDPDFDSYDVDNLDCRYMFFEDTIANPGLIAYFTSATQQAIMNGTIDDQIQILVGRTKWFALNGGPDCLKYVTIEELFQGKEISDKEDYVVRLVNELEHQVNAQPEAAMSMEVADAIETNRRFLAETQYFGCRFAQNLNQNWDGSTHNAVSDDQWMTTMGYSGSIHRPINTIFFNEDTRLSPEELLGNLMHENNHAVSFGNALVSSDGKKAYGKYGLVGRLLRIDAEGNNIGSIELPEYNGILAVEEEYNEQQAKKLTAIFKRKYGNVFEESDIINSNRSDDFGCLYDYWYFLVKRFIEVYGDRITDARLSDQQKIFFDFDNVPPATIPDLFKDYVKTQYKRHVKPEEFESRGFLSYSKLTRLGQIVEQFQKTVLPILEESEVPIDEVNARSGEHYDQLASNVKILIDSLEKAADKVVDSMIQDNTDNKRRAITRTFRKGEVRSAIERFTGGTKGKKYVIRGLQKGDDKTPKGKMTLVPQTPNHDEGMSMGEEE